MEKNKEIKKAMVLSSGGVDSTTCLGMAVEKYGKDQVTRCQFLRTETSEGDRGIQKGGRVLWG